jgi:transposase
MAALLYRQSPEHVQCRHDLQPPRDPHNRKRPKRGRKRLFNAAIHALRMRVERTFAWEDKFKRLLLRLEGLQQRYSGMKLMAYTMINL